MVVLPEPCNILKFDKIVVSIKLSDLKTNKHDDVGFPFLGFVGFNPGVDQTDEFLKYCLLDDDSLVKPWERKGNERYISVLIDFLTLSHFIKVDCLLDIVFQLLH